MFRGGVEGVHAVIASGGFARLCRTRWARPALRPIAASEVQLEALRLPGDRPLPPTWRAWLAFDTAWLASYGWLAEDARAAAAAARPLAFTPQPLGKIVGNEVGRMWGPFFDVPRLAHCFLLPGGSDSRRVMVLGDHPDVEGEYPVMYVDVDSMPELGAFYAGLDMYLGWAAGLLPEPEKRWVTYTDTAKLPEQRARNAHHVERMLGGEWSVEFPEKTLGG